MAVEILSDRQISARLFSIVGQYEPGSSFVRHVAICRQAVTISNGSRDVPVWQMGPPLVAGTRSQEHPDQSDSLNMLDLVGSLELSSDDIEGIQTWLAEVDVERRPAAKHLHYIARPHSCWKRDERQMPLYRRFSCVGLVVDCYQSIGIMLVETNRLPEVDVNMLVSIYGEYVARPKLRKSLGLEGDGPWDVLLPGYLFHSLVRPDPQIRSSKYAPPHTAHAIFTPQDLTGLEMTKDAGVNDG